MPPSRAEIKTTHKYLQQLVLKSVHIILQSRCYEGNGKRASAKILQTNVSLEEDFDVNPGGDIKQEPYYKKVKELWVEEVKKINPNLAKSPNGPKIGLKVKIYFRDQPGWSGDQAQGQNHNQNKGYLSHQREPQEPLEEWSIILDLSPYDNSQASQIAREVSDRLKTFLRMSNLLKSLLVMSRLSAGYQYAKEYDFETYFLYKIEPLSTINDAFNRSKNHNQSQITSRQIGKLATLAGTVEITYNFNYSVCERQFKEMQSEGQNQIEKNENNLAQDSSNSSYHSRDSHFYNPSPGPTFGPYDKVGNLSPQPGPTPGPGSLPMNIGPVSPQLGSPNPSLPYNPQLDHNTNFLLQNFELAKSPLATSPNFSNFRIDRPHSVNDHKNTSPYSDIPVSYGLSPPVDASSSSSGIPISGRNRNMSGPLMNRPNHPPMPAAHSLQPNFYQGAFRNQANPPNSPFHHRPNDTTTLRKPNAIVPGSLPTHLQPNYMQAGPSSMPQMPHSPFAPRAAGHGPGHGPGHSNTLAPSNSNFMYNSPGTRGDHRDIPSSGSSHSHYSSASRSNQNNIRHGPAAAGSQQSLKESMSHFISSDAKKRVLSRNNSGMIKHNSGNFKPGSHTSHAGSHIIGSSPPPTGYSLGSPMVDLPRSPSSGHPLQAQNQNMASYNLVQGSNSSVGHIGRSPSAGSGSGRIEYRPSSLKMPGVEGSNSSLPNSGLISGPLNAEQQQQQKEGANHHLPSTTSTSSDLSTHNLNSLQKILRLRNQMKFEADEIVDNSTTDVSEIQEIVEYGQTRQFDEQKSLLMDFASDFCKK